MTTFSTLPNTGSPGFGVSPYEQEWETTREFEGIELFFRPILPADKWKMKEMFYSLSEKSVYYRYMSYLKSIPREKLQSFCNVDGVDTMAIVGLLREESHERIIAVARYERDPASDFAECDFLVHDEYQRRGIGGFLVEYLKEIAATKGIGGFTATVHTGNYPMLHLFNRFSPYLTSVTDEGMAFIKFPLKSPDKGS